MSTGAVAASFGVSGAAGTTAAAAAADAKRRRNLEEELLTAYSEKTLADDWEFKILRSARGLFKEPERLREVLEEEARAGWIMVEKFDNSRIRLKRPPEARQHNRHLGFDPRRSYIGPSQGQREAKAAILIGVIVLSLAAAVGTVLLVING